MRIFFSTLYILLFIMPLNGQKKNTDANIIGDIKCCHNHIPFANITIDGTTIGTTADATGHFQLINLPIGTYTIRASCVGFKSATKEVTTIVGNTVELKFELEEDALKLEEVVVSADRNQINRAEAPVVVSSLSPELFIQTQSVNLAEGLCFTPGLRAECNCQNCGFTQLRMNGMDGPYTQVLLNSRPVFSGLAGVYSLELIPTNMIERVEVVRGGGSALFGANAIAGTVNVITKEPTRNTFDIDGRTSFIGIGNDHANTQPGMDQQLNVNTSVVTDDRKSGGYIYGMLRNKDPYDENGDGYSETVLLENTTFGFNAFHKPGAKSKINLDGYRVKEFRRGGNKLNMLPHEADIAEQLDHLITGLNLTFNKYLGKTYDRFTVYAALQHVDRDSYYGAEQDQNAYGHTGDLTSTIGIQYVKNANNFLFAPSSTVFGVDNTNNTIKDEKLGALGGSNTLLTNQMVNTIGAFVQHDWKAEKFKISVGLRYDNFVVMELDEQAADDHSDFFSSVLIPRVSFMYKITPDIRWRIGYAMGYRAPQIFNEDLHVELVNASRVLHFNAPELGPEKSHAFSSSINTVFAVGDVVGDILIEGFYIRLIDPFADEFAEDSLNLGTFNYVRVNANGGKVIGLNTEINTHFSKKLDLQIGFTYKKSQYDEALAWGEEPRNETNEFIRSPDSYGYGILSYKPLKGFTISLSCNYTGAMYVPHFGLSQDDYDGFVADGTINDGDVIVGERFEKSEQFFIIDLMISYDFKISRETTLQLYGGMKNVFNQTQKSHDRGIFRDAGYIYGPCQSRTINIGLKLGNTL